MDEKVYKMNDSVSIEPYIRLCAAIVNSGIRSHDSYFLSSEWCTFLINEVVEYNNKQDNRHVNVLLLPKGGSSGKDL